MKRYIFLLLGLLLMGGCGRAFKYAFATEPKLESIYPRNGAYNVARDVRVRFEIWPRESYVNIDFFWRDETGERRWVNYQKYYQEKYDTVKILLVPDDYLRPNTKYFLIIQIAAYFDGYYDRREKMIESCFTTGDWVAGRGEENEFAEP